MNSPSRSIESIVRTLGLLAAAALVIGYIVPAWAAWVSGVFFSDGVLTKMNKAGYFEAVNAFNEDKATQNKLEGQITEIDSLLVTAVAEQRGPLLSVRHELEQQLARSKSRVSIQGFNGHPVSYFWPVMYFCLGCLVTLLPPLTYPEFIHKTRIGWLINVSLSIYIIMVWGLWFRNFFLRDMHHGRIVFAYPNADISGLCFALQNVNYLIFAGLLAIIWQQWTLGYVARKGELESSRGVRALDFVTDAKRQKQVSDAMANWQITFVLLSTGFAVFTYVHWYQVVGNRDFRFMFEAITEHLLWILTAAITASPFLSTWRSWQSRKLQAQGDLLRDQSCDTEEVSSVAAEIRELRPIGSWNVAASGLTVVSWFVSPIIQSLLK